MGLEERMEIADLKDLVGDLQVPCCVGRELKTESGDTCPNDASRIFHFRDVCLHGDQKRSAEEGYVFCFSHWNMLVRGKEIRCWCECMVRWDHIFRGWSLL